MYDLTCLAELGLGKGRLLCLISVRRAIEYTRLTLIHLRQLRHAWLLIARHRAFFLHTFLRFCLMKFDS